LSFREYIGSNLLKEIERLGKLCDLGVLEELEKLIKIWDSEIIELLCCSCYKKELMKDEKIKDILKIIQEQQQLINEREYGSQ
jgi:hypothetical protein